LRFAIVDLTIQLHQLLYGTATAGRSDAAGQVGRLR
jgi:hypothetical protein